MSAFEEWLDFLRDNPDVKERRRAVVDKLREVDRALKMGRRVNICIPVGRINSIAVDGNDDDRVYINDLGTIIFWEDIERAEICIQ